MTKGFNKLTKKEQQELEKLIKEITEDAKHVIEDYEENPSEMSGSSIHIHENSPFMNENYKDNKWKHVIHGTIEDGIAAIKKMKKDKKNT
jgi:TRAP-type C4-dicarboxylate transport system substrate-binding protein